MVTIVIIGIGSSLGAMTRYYTSQWATKHFGSSFPYGTFLVNATGSFTLALLATLASGALFPAGWLPFVGPGFLSGLTTFSSYSHETVSLLNEGSYPAAMLYLFGSLAAGLACATLGIVLADLLVG